MITIGARSRDRSSCADSDHRFTAPPAWPHIRLPGEQFATMREHVAINRVEWAEWPIVMHSLRTAIAVVASLLVARLFRLPEAYWAPITTMVITQSSLGAALTVSWQRFVGTMLGAVLGATMACYFGPHALVFGMSVFILGLLRRVTRS